MRRRTFLASLPPWPCPRSRVAKHPSVMKFVPQADLAVLDPIWTTTYQTRDHGFLVFDTLFGLDRQYKAAADGRRRGQRGRTARPGASRCALI